MLEDTEIRVDIVGKTGVEVFGGLYVLFCLSASWVTGKRRVCRGNGADIYVHAGNLGFGCPCNAEGFAVTHSTAAAAPCAGLAFLQFVGAMANLTSVPMGWTELSRARVPPSIPRKSANSCAVLAGPLTGAWKFQSTVSFPSKFKQVAFAQSGKTRLCRKFQIHSDLDFYSNQVWFYS